MSYPHYTEFSNSAPNPPYCNGLPIGCVVCATADIIKAMKGTNTTNLSALGTDMGNRCRAYFGGCHGLCSQGCAWGVCCAWLELKARGINVGYSRLSHTQLRAQAAARHPMVIAGTYGSIPSVSASSYSSTVPARGRSDSFTGNHAIALWFFDGVNYFASDADFGSPGRPVIPPYSALSASAVEAFYDSRGWPAAYCATAPYVTNHYYASVTVATSLWNDATKAWVYNGPNAIKVGTRLVIRGAKYVRGGVQCYPIVDGTTYGGYWVPVAHVKITGVAP